MQDDKRPLINELCYNLHLRNQIEIKRNRAKGKISYYKCIKDNIKKYKDLAERIRECERTIKTYERSDLTGSPMIRQAQNRRDNLIMDQCRMEKPSDKWVNNKQELNKLILKYKAEYMKARYETAKLTCHNRQRVHRLCKLLNAHINYGFGTSFVKSVSFEDEVDPIGSDSFEQLAREYEANKAVDKMLRKQ